MDEIFRQAVFAMQAGKIDSAERSLRKALQGQPRHVGALNLLSVLLTQTERFDEAERYIRLALEQDARSDATFYNYGLILKALKRPGEALERFDQALQINPLIAETWNNRGTVLNDLERYEEAIADFNKAIGLNPHYAEAFFNKGKSLTLLKLRDEACAAFETALALKPELAEGWLGLGNIFFEQMRYQEALAAYQRALSLKRSLAEGWLGLGNIFLKLKRFQDALSEFDQALALKPDLAHAWFGRGSALDRLKRHKEATQAYRRVMEINPQHPFVKGALLHQQMLCCTWKGLDDLIAEIDEDIIAGRLSTEPFGWQAVATTPQSPQRCAELFSAERFPPKYKSHFRPPSRDPKPIRIGYVSGELRDQATSHLIVGVLERHDRSAFEIYGFDNGWNDGSNIRRRIEAAIPTIIDISSLNDGSAAAVIYGQQIDILINLNGYFGEERTGIFSERPAPIQVNYLGFPGTLGAPYVDYLIADRCVIPPEHQKFYAEKIVYLPECYQANDDKRYISERIFARTECALPSEAFVFCCFNNSYKIVPDVFDCWMHILRRVEGSVLWLLEDNPIAAANLRREAAAKKVNPERLVFAKRIPLPDHLARHRLADLFLDTLPYNAHTTASDALWAGLPLLTQIGETFPGRVAASLLQAIGLDELITSSREAYQDLAIELAADRQKLLAIKRRLAVKRLTSALFDTKLFTRRIEAAYKAMYERHQRGLLPDHIAVGR